MLITSTTNTVCLKCWLGDDDDDFGTILEWVTSDEESEAFYDGDPREANRDPLNKRTHPHEPEPEPSPNKRQRRT